MKHIILTALILIPLFPSANTDGCEIDKVPRSIKTYVNKYVDIAIAEEKQFCIPAEIKLAQAILESGVGESRLTKETNNHFGIKCFASPCTHKDCRSFNDDKPDDLFRGYETNYHSYRHHSRFLSRPRYYDCIDCGDDLDCWAYNLRQCGYATNENYCEKLNFIINNFNLTFYVEQFEAKE